VIATYVLFDTVPQLWHSHPFETMMSVGIVAWSAATETQLTVGHLEFYSLNGLV
jgi:hypothetical protein